jgi:hypothetical protein
MHKPYIIYCPTCESARGKYMYASGTIDVENDKFDGFNFVHNIDDACTEFRHRDEVSKEDKRIFIQELKKYNTVAELPYQPIHSNSELDNSSALVHIREFWGTGEEVPLLYFTLGNFSTSKLLDWPE